MVFVWIVIASLPLALSVWALLDVTRRPAWAWSLAERSQLNWLLAIILGTFLVIIGVIISSWYLLRVRPVIAAIENGNLDRLDRLDPN